MVNFSQEYTEGFHSVIRWLRIKGLSPDEAEEISQQAWARAWERRAQFRDECPFLYWVLRIAWFEWLAVLRSAYRRRSSAIPKHLVADSRNALHAEARVDVGRILRMLPRDLRRTVRDVYLKDIRTFEMPNANVARIRLHHAKVLIRERMAA